MWVLEIEIMSSGVTYSTLNLRTISLGQDHTVHTDHRGINTLRIHQNTKGVFEDTLIWTLYLEDSK